MRALLAAALCLVPIGALAQGESPRPDYSRSALLRMFAPRPSEQLPPGRVQWHHGYLEVRAFGTSWRFMPLLAPLPGGRLEDNATIPNPFALTGTPYASTMPPMFDRDRSWAEEREYRRIEKMLRKQRVTVTR